VPVGSPDILGDLAATWSALPAIERTNATNDHHISRVADVEISILRALSAMAEDAITDGVFDLNPFKGVRIRANDPRAKKKPRPIRVFSFEEMHRFAKAAGRYEAMVRVFTDCGLRLGEVLPLRREDFDGETLQVRRTAHEGQILEGTKTDHGEPDAGRVVPVPATLAWMLEAQINLNGPTASSSSRRLVAASGASAPSTGTSGSQPRKPPA
jgi:integrase